MNRLAGSLCYKEIFTFSEKTMATAGSIADYEINPPQLYIYEDYEAMWTIKPDSENGIAYRKPQTGPEKIQYLNDEEKPRTSRPMNSRFCFRDSIRYTVKTDSYEGMGVLPIEEIHDPGGADGIPGGERAQVQ
jgi:hypothetical protein